MTQQEDKKKASFDEELYTKLAISNLILFSILSIKKKQKECTFEELMKECFTNFPKAFGFNSIPKWPDSRKLDRPLRTLRNKKLIKGDPKTSFSLTEAGKKTVKDIVRILTQKKLW